MANTSVLYNAAYTGALSGISSRWLTASAEPTYANVIDCCAAFAEAVDENLGVVEEISQASIALLQQICSSFWEGRIPTHSTADDYAAFVDPLCSLFLAASAGLEPSFLVPLYSVEVTVSVGEVTEFVNKEVTFVDEGFIVPEDTEDRPMAVLASSHPNGSDCTLANEASITDGSIGEVTLIFCPTQSGNVGSRKVFVMMYPFQDR